MLEFLVASQFFSEGFHIFKNYVCLNLRAFFIGMPRIVHTQSDISSSRHGMMSISDVMA